MSSLLILFIFCMIMVPLVWWYCRVKFLKGDKIHQAKVDDDAARDKINKIWDKQMEKNE